MKNIALACLVLVMLMPAACKDSDRGGAVNDGPDVAMALPLQGDAAAQPDPALAAAVNDFGFDMARSVVSDQDNAIISPLSIHIALSMTYNGAAAQTAEEMANVLHIGDLDLAQLDRAYANLLWRMDASEDITLTIANSLWIDDEYSLRPTFEQANTDFFGAQTASLDLQAAGAADTINGWVSDATEGRIKDLISEPGPNATLFLVNAVYFLADWTSPFEPEATGPQPFTLANGEAVDVDMMAQGGEDWDYAENDRFQVVRMPYGTGSAAAYVIVPRDGVTPADLIGGWDAASWQSMRDSLEMREGSIFLPKFELEYDAGELADALEALGMASAFSDSADFSAMSEEPVMISSVKHKTYVRVDEKGTEAAAATSVEMAASAMPPQDTEPPFELRADKPFVFALADEDSGTLLFFGAVADPR